MTLATPLLVMALLLSGCSWMPVREVRVPVEIKVPVPVRVLPPAELLAKPDAGTLPTWLLPVEPGASSCLTPEGERQLKAFLAAQESRRRALEAWASEPK